MNWRRPKPERNWKREPLPRDLMLARVGRRICRAVQGGANPSQPIFNKENRGIVPIGCPCERKGGTVVCDAMKEAAASAFEEILNGER